jgi:hypothetical protein
MDFRRNSICLLLRNYFLLFSFVIACIPIEKRTPIEMEQLNSQLSDYQNKRHVRKQERFERLKTREAMISIYTRVSDVPRVLFRLLRSLKVPWF